MACKNRTRENKIKRKIKNNVTKEKIIEITLELIGEKRSSAGVTLSEIARRTGCASPNIYNYFIDLHDIFIEARVKILELYTNELVQSAEKSTGYRDTMLNIITTMFRWAFENPGWYYFLHFEMLPGEFGEKITREGHNTHDKMASVVYEIADEKISPEYARRISFIVHGYLVGEISKIITGRSLSDDNETYMRNAIDNSMLLMDALMQKK